MLSEMAQDPVRTPHQKQALEQLLSVMISADGKSSLELVLLRRQRIAAIARSGEAALTPSQLRKSREVHWVEVELVDKHSEQPVVGVSLELVLADGELRKLRSDDFGLVRVSPVPAGEVTNRLPELDSEMWTALGGAPARSVTLRGSSCQPGKISLDVPISNVPSGINTLPLGQREALHGRLQRRVDSRRVALFPRPRPRPRPLGPGQPVRHRSVAWRPPAVAEACRTRGPVASRPDTRITQR